MPSSFDSVIMLDCDFHKIEDCDVHKTRYMFKVKAEIGDISMGSPFTFFIEGNLDKNVILAAKATGGQSSVFVTSVS